MHKGTFTLGSKKKNSIFGDEKDWGKNENL